MIDNPILIPPRTLAMMRFGTDFAVIIIIHWAKDSTAEASKVFFLPNLSSMKPPINGIDAPASKYDDTIQLPSS